MRKNRIIRFLLVLFCLGLACGCKDEDGFGPENQDQLQWRRACRIYTLPVNTDEVRSWEIEGEWMLVFNPGERNALLEIYVEENSLNEDRSGSVRVVLKNGDSRTIRIRQLGRNSDSEGTPDSYERTMGVGWGYDCNSYYGDTKGVKDQIFNPVKIKRLSEKYGGDYLVKDEDYQTIGSFNCIGSSSSELSSSLAVEAEVNIGIPFAFSLDIKGRFATSDMESSSNYFAIRRYKSIIRKRSLETSNLLNLVARGEDIYTYSFKHYLKRLKESKGDLSVVREFIKIYGNSFVRSGEIGGRVDYNMTVRKTDVSSTKEVEIGVTVGLLSMFSISVTQQQQDVYSKMQKNSKFSLMANGGDVTILAKAVIDNEQCDEATFNEWLESIRLNNTELIDCQLSPIWDLIDDTSVASRVKAYLTKERIQEEALEIPVPSSLSVKVPVPTFKENETQVQVAWCAGTPVVEFCNEFLPEIDLKERVVVAYPVIRNKPDYREGIFVGNNGRFAPGIIRWTGDRYSYHLLSDRAIPGRLRELYVSDFTLRAEPTAGISYLAGVNKALNVTYYNRSYPVVKVDTLVWFRKDIESDVSNINEPLSVVRENGTYYYDGSTAIGKLPPVNWEIPSEGHLNSISKLTPTCSAFMEGGASGLDLKLSGGYHPDNQYEAGIFIMVGEDGRYRCARFTDLEPIRLSNIPVRIPVRPVRSSSFRYSSRL